MFNYDQPSTLPAAPRIIAIGDVHGDLGRVVENLKALQIIDNNLNWIAQPPNTVVVQVGDQVDSLSRGTTKDWETMGDVEVIKFMDRLDDIARRYGGRVISILGNHEFMNTEGNFMYVSEKSMNISGGSDKRAQAFRPGGQYAMLLSKRNIIVKIGNLVFCHGGILPQHLDICHNNYARINHVIRKYMRGESLDGEEQMIQQVVLDMDGIIWTRKYFELLSSGQLDELQSLMQHICNRLQVKSVVVGHNTVNRMVTIPGGSLWFVDVALSRAYDSNFNEILEILHDDDPEKDTEFRVIHINKTPIEMSLNST